MSADKADHASDFSPRQGPSGDSIQIAMEPEVTKTVATTYTSHIPSPKNSLPPLAYPLANSRTPFNLQSFKFDHNGRPNQFSELTKEDRKLLCVNTPVEEGQGTSAVTPTTTAVGDDDNEPLRRHLDYNNNNCLTKKRTKKEEDDPEEDSQPRKRVREQSDVPTSDELVLLSPATPPVENNELELKTTTTTTTTKTVTSQLPKFLDIPSMVSSFETLAPELKRYALFQLMRRCDRSTLSAMTGVALSALRRDFLSCLPPELCFNVLQYLDRKSLVNCFLVSRNWKRMVDSADWIWKNLMLQDRLVEEEDLPSLLQEFAGQRSLNKNSQPTPVQTPDAQERESNRYRDIYRQLYTINANWMDPNFKPKHLSSKGHGSDVVTCLQFDDGRIITGSDDHTINIYDIETGELKSTLKGHAGGVWALQYTDSNTLVSGSTDRTVRVWDIGKAKCTHVFQGHVSTVRCLHILHPVKQADKYGNVTYQPPIPLIVTGSRDATLKIWRLPQEGDPEYSDTTEDRPDDPFFLRTLAGHSNSVRAISGYGNTVVSGSYDCTVRVWNVNEGTCRWVLEGHEQRVYAAVIDHKRNRCISGSMDWTAKVWCLETGSLLISLDGHTSLVGLLDLNRTTLVSAAADFMIRVWNAENGDFLHKLSGHQGAITCVQHDEQKIVSGSETTLKLWNNTNGKLVKNLLDGMSCIWQVKLDRQRCIAAVKRGDETYIEVFDFNSTPNGTNVDERMVRGDDYDAMDEF